MELLAGPLRTCSRCGGKFTAKPVVQDDRVFCSVICASRGPAPDTFVCCICDERKAVSERSNTGTRPERCKPCHAKQMKTYRKYEPEEQKKRRLDTQHAYTTALHRLRRRHVLEFLDLYEQERKKRGL